MYRFISLLASLCYKTIKRADEIDISHTNFIKMIKSKIQKSNSKWWKSDAENWKVEKWKSGKMENLFRI